MIDFLVNHKQLDVNAKTKEKVTPLMKAARLGCTQTVSALLACPLIKLDNINIYKQTAFEIAKQLEHTEAYDLIIKALRQKGLEENWHIKQKEKEEHE